MATMVPEASGNKPVDAGMPAIEPVDVPGRISARQEGHSTELERNDFRLAPCIDSTPRRTLRHVTAGLPNQPFPLAADIQHREIAVTERRFLDRKAAVLEMVNHCVI